MWAKVFNLAAEIITNCFYKVNLIGITIVRMSVLLYLVLFYSVITLSLKWLKMQVISIAAFGFVTFINKVESI